MTAGYIIVLAVQKLMFFFLFPKIFAVLSHRGYLAKDFIWTFFQTLHFEHLFSHKAFVGVEEVIVLGAVQTRKKMKPQLQNFLSLSRIRMLPAFPASPVYADST